MVAGVDEGAAELKRAATKKQKREWAKRNHDKLRAYRAVYRKTAGFKAIAANNSRDCRERKKARGVAVDRMREPKTLARLSAVLRWQRSMESTNGSLRPSEDGELSVWGWCEVFGVPGRVRRDMAWADRGSRSVMAERWARENGVDLVGPRGV